MKLRDVFPSQLVMVSLSLLGLYTTFGHGLSMTYCSAQNTAEGAERTTSLTECNQGCPGYPDDMCGNATMGLFSYVPLGAPPSGTIGASSSSSSITQRSSTSSLSTSTPLPSSSMPSPPPIPLVPTSVHVSETVSMTVPITQTPSLSAEVSYVTQIPAAQVSVSTEFTSIIASPSILVVSISGAPVTKTVTPTAAAEPNSGSETIRVQQRTGLSAGAIAGVVLGVLFGVAALLLAAFLLWRRRQNQVTETTGASTALDGQRNNPKRNISVLSKTGLLARARPSMTERERERDHENDEHYFIPPLAGTNSLRHSMLLGFGEGVDPSSPLGGSQDGEARRSSKPFIYDQRLNPSALYASHDNGSRVSMQDNNDYSRPLGVANPDTRPSFESRVSH